MSRDTGDPSSENPAPEGFDALDDRDGAPDFGAARKHLLTELVRLVAVLRNDGVTVPASGTLSAARALATVGLDDEKRVAAALRASLLSETTDAEAFEEAFPTFWHRLRGGFDRIATAPDGPEASADGTDDTEDSDGSTGESGGDAGTLSDAEPPETDEERDGEVSVRIPTDRRHASGDRPAQSGDSESRRYSAVGEREPVDDAIPTPQSGELAAIDRFV